VSNQTRLFILVFFAFLPTVALYVHADRSMKAAQLADHETELLRLANQAGLEYRAILRDTESLLGALSEMAEFRTTPGPTCNRTLASIMRHMNHYTALQYIEPDGFVTCGSLAMDESLFVGDRYYHRATMANNRFTVGEFVIGRLTGKPIVGLAYPTSRADASGSGGVLAAYLDLDQLANGVYQMDVPQGTTLTVIDGNGTVMIRVPAGVSGVGTDTVGATVSAGFPTPSGEVIRGPYMMTGTDLDGVEKTFAVEPLEAAGRAASGHLLLARTQEQMLADTEAIGARRLQLLAVAAVFMFILAWMFGHYTLLRDRPTREA